MIVTEFCGLKKNVVITQAFTHTHLRMVLEHEKTRMAVEIEEIMMLMEYA